MRILIYILAMLTGFSAAEAARPVPAVPASVDASVGRAYTAVIVSVVQKSEILRLSSAPTSVVISDRLPDSETFDPVPQTTPVLRYDVIRD